jgi:hypothetical protein
VKVFQELKVTGPRDDVRLIEERLERVPGGRWSRDNDREARAAKHLQVNESDQQLFFVARLGKGRKVRLSLARDVTDGALEVTNVVPTEVGELSMAEYNEALQRFHDEVVAPAAEGLGEVTIELSEEDVDLTHWLSVGTAARLRSFSSLANRYGLHPYDRQRWNEFLIAAHREGTSLEGETLMRWLIEEEGWSEDFASDLVIEFENARDLLAQYDRQPISA